METHKGQNELESHDRLCPEMTRYIREEEYVFLSKWNIKGRTFCSVLCVNDFADVSLSIPAALIVILHCLHSWGEYFFFIITRCMKSFRKDVQMTV